MLLLLNYTIACVWRQLIWEWSDQLSQEGSQINIIADKTHAITIITSTDNVHVDLSL